MSFEETSRFFGISEFGGPEVLELCARPIPVPQPGEVRVRVAAATVNPTDVLLRKGQQAAMMGGLVPPFIAGMEFSGFIDGLGAEVDDLEMNAPVIGLVNPRRPRGGAYAEHLCVPASSVAVVSESADMTAAATVAMNGLTALASIAEVGGPFAGPILVTGGAGAVGGYVISLLARLGVEVIADAKPEDREFITNLGAAHVVARGESMAAEVIQRYHHGVAGCIDGARIARCSDSVLRPGGILVELRGSDAAPIPGVDHHVVSVLDHLHDEQGLRFLARAFDSGDLLTRVARTFDFAEATTAHRFFERGGVRGRVVLMADEGASEGTERGDRMTRGNDFRN